MSPAGLLAGQTSWGLLSCSLISFTTEIGAGEHVFKLMSVSALYCGSHSGDSSARCAVSGFIVTITTGAHTASRPANSTLRCLRCGGLRLAALSFFSLMKCLSKRFLFREREMSELYVGVRWRTELYVGCTYGGCWWPEISCL